MGLRLQGKDRALTGGPNASLCLPSPQGLRLPPIPVVALPGDGAVLVLLWACHPHILVGTAAGLGQQIQLGRRQHICRWGDRGMGAEPPNFLS